MSPTKAVFEKDTQHEKHEDELDLDDPATRLAVARHQFGLNNQKYDDGLQCYPIFNYQVDAPHDESDDQKVGLAKRGFITKDGGAWKAEDQNYESSVPIVPIDHKFGQYKGVNISIEVSDTFVFDSPEVMRDAMRGDIGPDDGSYIYSRSCNPTVLYLGSYLAAMENTESAYCTSSGMSAITAVMMHVCKTGGHVVCAKAIYGGTHFLLSNFLPDKCNITTTFVDITDLDEVENAIVAGKTDVLYFESISNPALMVANIPALCKIAHDKGAMVVVDNTFTPMIISPSKLGADVVIHSLTKYVSGGADIIAGAICGTAGLVKGMISFSGGPLMMLGPTMNPKEAFELVERMSHMRLRIKKQCNRAMKLAQRMKNELKLNVIYPGLEDHPQHHLLAGMKNEDYGFGAMLCIDMGTTKRAFDLVRNLKKENFGFLAISLGYYENLISCPGSLVSETTQQPKKQGHISPGLIRISVGYIDTLETKWKQFKKAYKAINN